MPQNTLFNFLNYRHNKKNSPFKYAESVTLKKTLDKNNYFFISLPHKNCSIKGLNNVFRRIRHHVSVFEFESKDKSQLHYTADFFDKDNNKYRLHVFYDRKDQVTSAPQLSREIGDKYKLINTTEINQELLNLAETSIRDILIEIREQHLQDYSAVESEYQRSNDKFSLFFDVKEMKEDDYLSQLKELIELTQSMAKLSSQTYYARQHRSLTRMLEMALQNPFKLEKKPLEKANQTMEMTTSVTTAEKPKKGTKAKPKSSTSHDKEKGNQQKILSAWNKLEANIDKLTEQFDILQQSSEKDTEKYTKELGNVWSYCNEYLLEADLLLDEAHAVDKTTCLNKLQKLSAHVEKTCKQCFFALLAENKLSITKPLQAFYYLLDINTVCTALKQNNAKLLDFALTYIDDLVLDHPVLIINNKRYENAVMYCYQQGFAACLFVLVKHNASILIPDKEGIPLAYHLLIQPSHPLSSVLTDSYPDKLIASLPFYLRFKNVLQRFITTQKLPADQIDNMNAALVLLQSKVYDLSLQREVYPLKQSLEYSTCAIAILMDSPLTLEFLKNQSVRQVYALCLETLFGLAETMNAGEKVTLWTSFSNLNNLPRLFNLNDVDEGEPDKKLEFLTAYIHDANQAWENLGINLASSCRSRQKVLNSTLDHFALFFMKYKVGPMDDPITEIYEEMEEAVQTAITTTSKTPQASTLPFFNKEEKTSQQKSSDSKLEEEENGLTKPVSLSQAC